MRKERQRIAGQFGIIGLLLGCLSGQTWAEAEFSYSQESDAVIVRYSRTPGELAAPDSSTTITVYGNGLAIVHYPPYGRRKGDYAKQMSTDELDQLVASLVDVGLMEYDHQEVKATKQAIMKTRKIGFHVADADISEFEIQLSSYSPTKGETQFDIHRVVSASALQTEAKHFPSVQSIVGLAAVERQLIGLINSDDLISAAENSGGDSE